MTIKNFFTTNLSLYLVLRTNTNKNYKIKPTIIKYTTKL